MWLWYSFGDIILSYGEDSGYNSTAIIIFASLILNHAIVIRDQV